MTSAVKQERLETPAQPTVTFLLRDRCVALNADGGSPTAKSGFLAKVLPALPDGEWDMRSEDDWHDHVATALDFIIENPESIVDSFTHACSVMTGADYLQLDGELFLPRVLDFFLSAATTRNDTPEDNDQFIPCIESPNAGDLLWSGMTEHGKILDMLQFHADRRVRVALSDELDISRNNDVTQQLLENAARNWCPHCPITSINAKGLRYIRKVNFCADTLTVLDVSNSGITQEGISAATKLTTLRAWRSKSIVSVDFCADTLTVLHVSESGITQEGVSAATKLTTLKAWRSKSIVSVDFCADTLTVSHVSESGITQEGISAATKLTTLRAWRSKSIASVDFCADTLTVLDVSESGITQEGVSAATKLTSLEASRNSSIVSVDFCADTLTVLDAGLSGMTPEGISKATRLT